MCVSSISVRVTLFGELKCVMDRFLSRRVGEHANDEKWDCINFWRSQEGQFQSSAWRRGRGLSEAEVSERVDGAEYWGSPEKRSDMEIFV